MTAPKSQFSINANLTNNQELRQRETLNYQNFLQHSLTVLKITLSIRELSKAMPFPLLLVALSPSDLIAHFSSDSTVTGPYIAEI